MRLRTQRRDSPEINLTSLIDVVFLLLIFFMVSTSFERASEIEIELPKATSEEHPAEPEVIEIAVDAQGRHYVGGQRLVNSQVETIREALRRAAGERAAPPLVLNADADAPYQAVVTVMDAASQLGFARLGFAHQQAREGD